MCISILNTFKFILKKRAAIRLELYPMIHEFRAIKSLEKLQVDFDNVIKRIYNQLKYSGIRGQPGVLQDVQGYLIHLSD